MVSKKAIILFMVLISSYCYGQKVVDMKYIEDCLRLNDTAYKSSKNTSYLVNSTLYSEHNLVELKSALKKIRVNQVMSVFLDGGVIHISTLGSQDEKEKVEKLKLAKTVFNDEYSSFSQHTLPNSKDPVLYLNGEQVKPTDCKKLLERLNPKDIRGISLILTPLPDIYWGQNARNGLVRIWTS